MMLNDNFIKTNHMRRIKTNDIIKVGLKTMKFIDLRDALTDNVTEEILHHFRIEECLSRSTNSDIHVALEKKSKKKVVIKTVKKIFGDKELSFMTKLNHPNIMKLLMFYKGVQDVHLVYQFMSHGDLISHLVTKKIAFLPDKEGKFAAFQIAEGLAYLHSQNIAHLDLKPTNILVHMQKDLIYKIANREWSCKEGNWRGIRRSTGYTFPEMRLNEDSSGIQSDLWSFGATIFAILTGYQFEQERDLQSFKMQTVNAKTLLQQLLVVNPRHRLASKAILQHPWFVDSQLTNRMQRLQLEMPLTKDARLNCMTVAVISTGRSSQQSKERTSQSEKSNCNTIAVVKEKSLKKSADPAKLATGRQKLSEISGNVLNNASHRHKTVGNHKATSRKTIADIQPANRPKTVFVDVKRKSLSAMLKSIPVRPIGDEGFCKLSF